MVQQAETVRLISSDSKPISATDISQDDEIIVVIDNSMRHIGSAVSGESENYDNFRYRGGIWSNFNPSCWVQERVAQSLSNCQLESISMMLK